MSGRRTAQLVPLESRTGSRARRAPLAEASGPMTAADAACIHTLVRHQLSKAAGRPGAARRLVVYSSVLRGRGKGGLVGLVNAAMLFDGGRLLRLLAPLADADAVSAALTTYVQIAGERRILDTASLSLLIRACLQGSVLDRLLVAAMQGKWGKAIGVLDSSARLNLATALAMGRVGADGRAQVDGADEFRRKLAEHARREAEREARERAEDEQEEGENHDE